LQLEHGLETLLDYENTLIEKGIN